MFGFFNKKNNKQIALKKFQEANLTMEEAEYMIWDIAMSNIDDHSHEDISENDLDKSYNSEYFNNEVNKFLNEKALTKDLAYTGLVTKTMVIILQQF